MESGMVADSWIRNYATTNKKAALKGGFFIRYPGSGRLAYTVCNSDTEQTQAQERDGPWLRNRALA